MLGTYLELSNLSFGVNPFNFFENQRFNYVNFNSVK